MEDKHRQALRRHWSELRKDLEPKRLLPHMVSVLDVADEQEIISQDTREEQVDVMLEMLPRRGPNAFHCFVKALGLTQHFLAAPFKREEEMDEMRTELNRVRIHSSKMREEMGTLHSQLDGEKLKHEKTRKEMEELKSLHQSLLKQTKNERSNLHFQIHELKSSESTLKRQLEDEREMKTKILEEVEQVHKQCHELREKLVDKDEKVMRLRKNLETRTQEREEFVSDKQIELQAQSDCENDFCLIEEKESRSYSEVSETREKSYTGKQRHHSKSPPCEDHRHSDLRMPVIRSKSGTQVFADELATTLGFQEIHKVIAKISRERDEAKEKCTDLEKQLESYEVKENLKNLKDRATSPLEIDTDDLNKCTRCSEVEEKSKEFENERNVFQKLKEQFQEEIRQLNRRIAEIKEKYEREKRKLQGELKTVQENYEALERDNAAELAKMKEDMSEQRRIELQDLQTNKSELCDQLEKSKIEIHRVKVELEKEKSNLNKMQKEFEIKRKKLVSDKKQLKQKIEDESKLRKDNLKEMEQACHEYEDREIRNRGEMSRLQRELSVNQDKVEHLMEELERWRTLPGRVHNYRKDFDRNGVIYALGTNFGHSPWVNPGDLGMSPIRVTVTRSSQDQGKAVDLLENRKGTLSCTKDEEGSWWCLDLGPRFTLFPTRYTVRHGRDNGLSVMRNWRLEGSLDNRKWWTLKCHDNDRGFKGTYPFYTGTWAIDGEIRASRYIRIYQTGKNSSGRYSLYLSGLELYGVLLDMGHD